MKLGWAVTASKARFEPNVSQLTTLSHGLQVHFGLPFVVHGRALWAFSRIMVLYALNSRYYHTRCKEYSHTSIMFHNPFNVSSCRQIEIAALLRSLGMP
jgi:hypothetical protein